MRATAGLSCGPLRPRAAAAFRHWKSRRPRAGSTVSRNELRTGLLDLHSPSGRSDQRDALRSTVDDEPQVELACDVRRRLDEDASDQCSTGTRLRRDEAAAEQIGCNLTDLLERACDAHAAGFSAPAGVDLGLHDPPLTAQLGCTGNRLVRRVGNGSRRDRDTVGAEELLGLMLVDVHAWAAIPSPDRLARCHAIVRSRPSSIPI